MNIAGLLAPRPRFGKGHKILQLDLPVILRPLGVMINFVALTHVTMTIRLAGRVAGLTR